MKPAFTFTVRPRLPEPLAFLGELAYNVWWSWNFDAIELFQRIDQELWGACSENPVLLLGRADQERLDALATDQKFLAQMEQVRQALHDYLNEPRWFQRSHPEAAGLSVAYLSAEYGLARCLPVYSGGLGVLSGDHLKTASDMGLPLVGVGLAYQQGYFRQYLNIDGWQQERYEENDFYNMPIQPVQAADGQQLIIDVPYAGYGGDGAGLQAYIWRIQVGRIPLYLLSTNVPANRPEDRTLTAQLYGGDRETRIRQEIVLGVGGVQVLKALEIQASVFHMNEGHSAFLALERIRELMHGQGLSFAAAYETVFTSDVFTTHTAVPAGTDVFDNSLARLYLEPMATELGIGWDELRNFGRVHTHNGDDTFTMPVLALRASAFSNGVSQLHSAVSREMWRELWPRLPVNEVPILPITNGVHLPSWVSREMSGLYDRHLGAAWRSDTLQDDLWERIHAIPDEELWQARNVRRARLIAFARERLAIQLVERGASSKETASAADALDPAALTIGFARRFATYKRATLLFRDVERLSRMVDEGQPVQFIFAGKAHPRDDEGKNYIRQLIHAVRDTRLRAHIVFLENYDLQVARYMVQGCDVWLNTPRRPLEASGTSGMKAVANGGLHLSTLDGWWAQAYAPEYGWAIGGGELYGNEHQQDEVEGDALYDLLEGEVIPLFYDRPEGQLPAGWLARMKASMAGLIPRFCSDRMLRNYIEEAYIPASQRYAKLQEGGMAGASSLARWRENIEEKWNAVRVDKLEVHPAALASNGMLHAGEQIELRAILDLDRLTPDDVAVEAYWGLVDSQGNFVDGEGQSMAFDPDGGPGKQRFLGKLSVTRSGHYGFTVRVFPRHDLLASKYATQRVTWSEPED